MSTQFYGNKHCVPNNGKISHATWKIPFLVKHCSPTAVPMEERFYMSVSQLSQFTKFTIKEPGRPRTYEAMKSITCHSARSSLGNPLERLEEIGATARPNVGCCHFEPKHNILGDTGHYGPSIRFETKHNILGVTVMTVLYVPSIRRNFFRNI
jgi:hypothetical protein